MTRQSTRNSTDRRTDLPSLSVVVIARNEADRIGRCLESVLTATEPFDAEVVVVDSNSTDGTVSRAAEFPVSVLRIPTDDLSTPSAGRYVGGRYARGEQILFVDGDVVLSDGDWLETAARTLAERSDLAGVGGHLSETTAADAEAVEWLAGVALYDAGALAEVGGFDPYLRSLEDIHLGFELNEAGYRLVRLPVVVGEQVRDSSDRLEALRRWRRGFFHGMVDAVFRSADSPKLLVRHLHEIRHPLTVAAWVLVGAASLLALPAFALWVAASTLGLVVLAYTQGLARTYKLVTFWAAFLLAVATHEWREPPDRTDYPLDRIRRVTEGPRLGAPEATTDSNG